MKPAGAKNSLPSQFHAARHWNAKANRWRIQNSFELPTWVQKNGLHQIRCLAFKKAEESASSSFTRFLYQVQYTKCNTLRLQWEDIQQVDQKMELSLTNRCPTIAIGQPESDGKKCQILRLCNVTRFNLLKRIFQGRKGKVLLEVGKEVQYWMGM